MVLKEKTGPLSESDDCEIDSMVRTAKECAGFSQRSSSCVEGRNAQFLTFPAMSFTHTIWIGAGKRYLNSNRENLSLALLNV